jgi:phage terminase large subunit GpA-like protein
MPTDRQNPLIEGFFSVFRKPTRLTVSQWADQYRYLSSKGSASPGKYRSSRTPYMRAPMDDLSVLSPVQEVVLIMAAVALDPV